MFGLSETIWKPEEEEEEKSILEKKNLADILNVG
jgi:hypothetical protein